MSKIILVIPSMQYAEQVMQMQTDQSRQRAHHSRKWGVFERDVSVEGETIRRYWIEL